MKFSVIVPVYNVEKYLTRCLSSIFAQNFSDYEIIAVDDGSTDNSGKILDEQKSNSEHLLVIHQENRGLGGARNTGIKNASGDYLLFVDSDDYIAPHTLSTLASYLQHSNLDIIAFDCIQVSENGSDLCRVSETKYSDKFTILSQKQFMLFEPTICIKSFRKELFIKNNIYFPEHLWYEDLATFYRLIPFATQIGYLKEPFYNYVQQTNSITHSSNTKRMMEITTAFSIIIEFYKKNNLFYSFYEELEWNCALHVLYYSAFRYLSCGYHYKEMSSLFEYSKSIFPNIKKNKYVLQQQSVKYLMSTIMSEHYFRFFLKTGFTIKYINPLRDLVYKGINHDI